MKRQSGPFMTIIFACAAALAALGAALPAQAQTRPIRLVALGDSLSAGYNLPQEAAFPVVLEKALKARGHNVEVANAGVSGDTSSGGLDRLDWSVPDGTDGVILELGANDMLRGLDPAGTRRNLVAIVERLKSRNIQVMLAGMYASRNLGPDYVQKFDSIYPDIAKTYDLVLYPFFLDGVAGEKSLNLPDGMHPTAKGVEVIVERILPSVESFLARLAQR
ncbi:arylesterase [Microvirga mediterraneensis]|uniref:Arylesterase n=1 Tax=Microvirga mediterraneensis TaxID=2754695 RepID=A0A838BIP7_9HYPH|nr:arylesterase [Microvirga mediterraneensis]MBA1155065.1 arylesterase [Microvirga mediterraneensis]